MTPTNSDGRVAGVACAAGAFILWGVSPILWKAVSAVPPVELLAHRVAWCALLLTPILVASGPRGALRAVLARRRTRWSLLASTALIAFNWFLFIYAVQTDRLMEASLGYYINPLVNVLLGTLFLGERLRRRQWIAVALAGIGVLVLTIGVGHPPWIALGLAFSFGFYGLVRKTIAASAVQGVALETWFLAPIAVGTIGYLALVAPDGTAAFGRVDALTHVLLVATGGITAVPLILFGLGARRLDYSTVGILQYFAPTLQFLLAALAYGEPFGTPRRIAFLFIWTAVALYCHDALAQWRRSRSDTSA